jgi:NAD(P)-dependent dehydrogenase (short-subunit alcohol dehydrogenase family)
VKILVTGANRGLGLEFTKTLLGRGDEVIATCRSLAAATELRELAETAHGKLQVVELDVATPEGNAALGAFLADKAVDVLINNAGHYSRDGGPFESLNFDGVMTDFAINAMGTLRVTQTALGALRRGKTRKIAVVSSKMGSITDNTSGGSYAYRMSKAAINMGVKSLANDLRGEGFTVLTMHPGWVLTDMGGPNALIGPEESIQGMLRVIDGAGLEQSGKFWDFRGNELPW